MSMLTYSIGRSADIRTPADERSVSGLHADVTITSDDRYYLTDRNSTNGTRVLRGGRWQTVRQEYVGLHEPLRLGSLETTLALLLDAVAVHRPPASPEPEMPPPAASPVPRERPRRNPKTGEVIDG